MKNLSTLSFFIIGLLSFHCLAAQDNHRLTSLNKVVDTLLQRNEFNGTLLYAVNGKIQYEKSFGNLSLSDKTPLDKSSSFNLASLTKQFIGLLTLKIKEKYPFSLDDPIQKYILSFPYANIKIKHLLYHTSGLQEYFYWAENQTGPLDTIKNNDVLAFLANQKPALLFTPGSKFQYCNTGYIIMTLVLENITAKPINELMDQFLIQPLNLTNTKIHTINTYHSFPNRVKGFKEENGKLVQNDLYRIDGVFGDGNLYSSANDLLKWTEAWKRELLKAKNNLLEAFQPTVLNNGKLSNYGFGFQIDTLNIQYSHTGSWVGFYNYLATNLKSKETIILLTNNSNSTASRAIQQWFNHKTVEFQKSTLITNVRIIDGTGLPERKGSLRIKGNKIVEMGLLNPYIGEEVIDGQDNILAPGFIDTHSHHEGGLEENLEALPVLSQGITTICIGQDGFSLPMDSLKSRYAQHKPAINLLSYTGHASLRIKQMGLRGLFRTASDKEIEGMKLDLENELKKGSFGISTGLEYEEGFFSNKNEVISLAQIAAKYKARYMSHIRSEDIQIENAIDEIIQIGAQVNLPVQISHIKIAQKSKWGNAPQIIQQLQAARQKGVKISADIYPYTYWQSTLRVLFPNRDYDNPAAAEFAVNQLFDPSESILLRFAPNKDYVGKTISQIAEIRKSTDAETLQRLVADASLFEENNPDYSGSIEGIMGKAMSEEDLKTFLSWPFTNVCSDGGFTGHPRGRGAFPRIISNYVRNQPLLTLPTAIYKMTGLCAENLGLTDRGILSSGNFADMVLFNPAIIKDKATITQPQALSEGILQVWVNGNSVYKDGKSTNQFPGIIITRN
ncbi:MAG: serine hydrolase [Saprospiraceae bacterium]|nr:serine hydrolase [Saprospiraceae bacterium]